jgi:hypothetical protein
MATAASLKATPRSGDTASASTLLALPYAVRQVGLWSGLLYFLLSYVFFIASLLGIAGILLAPWDVISSIGASLLFAPILVALMACVYESAPVHQKIWGLLGLACALLYAALVSIVYVTWLFVLEPQVLSRNTVQVQPFLFEKGSFLMMLDGLGYTYSCLAALCVAPIFGGNRLARWVRWLGIANGIVALPVFLSYVLGNIALGIWWQLTLPTFALLLALLFRRANPIVPLQAAG